VHRQVLCGTVPFAEITHPGGVIVAIMKGIRPPEPQGAEALGFTKGLWKIIERCWLANASERRDVKGVLFQLNHATWAWGRKQSGQ